MHLEVSSLSIFIAAVAANIADKPNPANKITDKDTCYQVIEKLSMYDEKIQHRPAHKVAAAAAVAATTDVDDLTPEERSVILNKGFVPDGLYNECGASADLVVDVFHGTQVQEPPELPFTGDNIRQHFEMYAKYSRGSHILHDISIEGLKAGHAYVVEQIPGPKGTEDPTYRIYQSSRGFFSLKAWLTPANPNTAQLAERDKHIRESFYRVCGMPMLSGAALPDICKKDNHAKNLGELYKKIKETFPGTVKQLKEQGKTVLANAYQHYLDNMDAGTKANAIKILETSWKLYGNGRNQGTPLTKTQFLGPDKSGEVSYVTKLAKVAKFLSEYSKADDLVQEEPYNVYKELFAAPMGFVAPGLPRNTVVPDKDLKGGVKIHLYMRMTELTEEERNKFCVAEGRRIGGPHA